MIELTEQEKQILVLRANDELLADIASEYKMEKEEVSLIFLKVTQQIKTPEDVMELQKIMAEFTAPQTEGRSRRTLDGIPMDHLVQYVLDYYPDEVREQLVEAYGL